MLSKKLNEIGNNDSLWRLKDPEKIMEGLSKVINAMKDLINLSKQHNIQNKLYYGDGLQRIFRLLGDYRVTRWLNEKCEADLEGEELWSALITFLQKEVKV